MKIALPGTGLINQPVASSFAPTMPAWPGQVPVPGQAGVGEWPTVPTAPAVATQPTGQGTTVPSQTAQPMPGQPMKAPVRPRPGPRQPVAPAPVRPLKKPVAAPVAPAPVVQGAPVVHSAPAAPTAAPTVAPQIATPVAVSGRQPGVPSVIGPYTVPGNYK